MTERAISPLRQRMIEDMAIRRLAPGTQAFYVSAVAKFARHFGRAPDSLDTKRCAPISYIWFSQVSRSAPSTAR
jgi:hypothetical protein